MATSCVVPDATKASTACRFCTIWWSIAGVVAASACVVPNAAIASTVYRSYTMWCTLAGAVVASCAVPDSAMASTACRSCTVFCIAGAVATSILCNSIRMQLWPPLLAGPALYACLWWSRARAIAASGCRTVGWSHIPKSSDWSGTWQQGRLTAGRFLSWRWNFSDVLILQ